jgi:ABC-type amino acid transport substrate-binding protein
MTMRRLAILAGGLLALPALARVASATDLADIGSRGTLRVLAANDGNPLWFSFQADGEPGFERELLAGFARVHKLELEVVEVVRWDDAIPDLVKGRGDVLAGVNATEARRKRIDFSDELLPAQNVVVTRKPRSPVRTLDQLRTERIAVSPGTTWSDAVVAAKVPATHVVNVESAAQAFVALREEKATATVLDVVDFLFERHADPALELGMTLGEPLSSAWGVRKADPSLRQALNAYLLDLRKGAGWSRLVVKYFGEDALAVLGRATAK